MPPDRGQSQRDWRLTNAVGFIGVSIIGVARDLMRSPSMKPQSDAWKMYGQVVSVAADVTPLSLFIVSLLVGYLYNTNTVLFKYVSFIIKLSVEFFNQIL